MLLLISISYKGIQNAPYIYAGKIQLYRPLQVNRITFLKDHDGQVFVSKESARNLH